MNWAVKYRPRTFSAVKGQPEKAILFHMVREESVPSVVLFSGPPGTGKTTLARILAASLNCENPQDGEPCTECPSCESIYAGNHPSVQESDGASNGSAEDMRSIREDAYMAPIGRHRVFIIDEAHSLSWQAWNVLLKLFEEPPSDVVFVLVTSEPNKVPVKIRTRSISFAFTPLTPKHLTDRLTYILNEEDAEIEELDTIIDLSDGSLREAIMLLEQSIRAGKPPAELYRGRDVSVALIAAAVKNDRAECYKLAEEAWQHTGNAKGILEGCGRVMEKILFIRHDIVVYASEGQTRTLDDLAVSIDDQQWVAGLEALSLWLPRTTTKAHVTFAITDFLKALHGATVPTRQAPVQDTNNRRIGIEQALESMGFE
jgi:DNA polymerase III subunit gamma/tau